MIIFYCDQMNDRKSSVEKKQVMISVIKDIHGHCLNILKSIL